MRLSLETAQKLVNLVAGVLNNLMPKYYAPFVMKTIEYEI